MYAGVFILADAWLCSSILHAKAYSNYSSMSLLEEVRKEYNYSVLKKHDPQLDELIFTSSICDVYEFDSSVDSWVQKHEKGTLFFYSTKGITPFSILVLNRLGPTDFKLGITPALQSAYNREIAMAAEMQDSTIMVQKANDVYGLWLFEESDRAKLLQLIKMCIASGKCY